MPQESLRLTIDSDYPDAPLQILQLFESPRTGDELVVSSKPKAMTSGLPGTENPEHHGSEEKDGSLHKDHMVVPVLVSRPAQCSTTYELRIFQWCHFQSIVRYQGRA